jgi:hypothetical protein
MAGENSSKIIAESEIPSLTMSLVKSLKNNHQKGTGLVVSVGELTISSTNR